VSWARSSRPCYFIRLTGCDLPDNPSLSSTSPSWFNRPSRAFTIVPPVCVPASSARQPRNSGNFGGRFRPTAPRPALGRVSLRSAEFIGVTIRDGNKFGMIRRMDGDVRSFRPRQNKLVPERLACSLLIKKPKSDDNDWKRGLADPAYRTVRSKVQP
jgi:hypothetical protein